MEEGGTICFSSAGWAGWGAVARGRSHDSRFSFSLLQKGEQISQAISSARAKVHRGIAFSRNPAKAVLSARVLAERVAPLSHDAKVRSGTGA